MKTTAVLEALAALAQESRLAIFRYLVQIGPDGCPVGQIAEHLKLPPATLSFHLKELSRAKLLTGRQAGRFIWYSTNFDSMNGLIEYLTENCCGGTSCAPQCKPTSKPRQKVAA